MKITTKDDKNSKPPVPAIEKALDVLELLADTPAGLSMNDIAQTLNRTMGELYRVVVHLTQRGYLVQDSNSGRYQLSLKLFELSHRHEPTEHLIRSAVPILEDISKRTNQSCHLGILNGDKVVILAANKSPLPVGYSVATGAILPSKQTSLGYVILAYSDEQKQQRYLDGSSQGEQLAIEHRLREIRHQGFERMESQMVVGVENLCAPVFDLHGITAAITCGFIQHAQQIVSSEEAMNIVMEGAQTLSKQLGSVTAEPVN